MTEGQCRACEAEIVARPVRVGDVFWGQTEAGHPFLMEARPHKWTGCKAKPTKRPKKAPAPPERPPWWAEAVDGLQFVYKSDATEAERWLEGVTATDFQDAITQAVKRKGEAHDRD